MSDQPGGIGTTTNGNSPNGHQPPADAQPPSAGGQIVRPSSAQSVDERLEALLQTIRTWDWRSSSVEPDPPLIGDPGAPPPSAQISSAPAIDHGSPEAATLVPPPPSASDIQTLLDPAPRHAMVAPLSVEQPDTPGSPPVPPAPETMQDPATLIRTAPVGESAVAGSQAFASPTTVEPLATGQPQATIPTSTPPPPAPPRDPSPLIVGAPVSQFASLLGSNEAPTTAQGFQPQSAPVDDVPETASGSRIRVVLFFLGALVVVLLVIGAIRLFSDKNQGSGPTEPTTTTTVSVPTTHAASSVAPVLPIPSAQLTQYEQAAQPFDQASTTASKSLTGSGAARTPAEVVPVATTYATALNTYSLELAYIKWPASLETAVKADQGQLVILASYLKSIDAVSAAGLDSWLAQMRAQATTTESLDNALRQELDLSKTTAFPT